MPSLTTRIKPTRWNVSPGLVSPEWGWAYQGLTVQTPLQGVGLETVGKALPSSTSQAAFLATPKGVGIGPSGSNVWHYRWAHRPKMVAETKETWECLFYIKSTASLGGGQAMIVSKGNWPGVPFQLFLYLTVLYVEGSGTGGKTSVASGLSAGDIVHVISSFDANVTNGWDTSVRVNDGSVSKTTITYADAAPDTDLNPFSIGERSDTGEGALDGVVILTRWWNGRILTDSQKALLFVDPFGPFRMRDDYAAWRTVVATGGITPAPISNPLIVVVPIISAGSAILTPSPVSDAIIVADPAISAGAITALPAPVSDPIIVANPTVSAGQVTLIPAPVSDPITMADPAISAGPVTLIPSPVSDPITTVDPIISAGSVALTPASISNPIVVADPTISAAISTIAPTPVSNPIIVADPILSAGASTLAPAPISDSIIVADPTVSAGSVALTLAPVSDPITVADPIISAGAITAAPSPIAILLGVADPIISAGPATLTPAPVSDPIVVADPTISSILIVPTQLEATLALLPILDGEAIVEARLDATVALGPKSTGNAGLP